METKEGNKLIAEFMGGYTHITPKDYPENNYWKLPTGSSKELEFHSSWDWLMPVVEKIHNISSGKNQYEESAQRDVAFMLFGLSITSPIDTVYSFVIKYIQWYNEQKTK